MIWLLLLVLLAVALLPLGLVLRRQATAQGGRDLAMALHREQLAELDRDLAERRILPVEHETARLEVQRRLLAAADTQDRTAVAGSRTPVWTVLALVPVAAFGLYLVGGQPGLPSLGNEGRDAAGIARQVEEAALIAQLRERLAALDPRTDQARQGYVLLGNVEESRGNDAAAAEAWRTALAGKFDATLATRTAEAAIRAEGGMSPSSVALLRRALAAAPPDAPWRASVEQRLAGVR